MFLDSLRSTQTHPPLEFNHIAPFKYRCPIKISDQIRPIFPNIKNDTRVVYTYTSRKVAIEQHVVVPNNQLVNSHDEN